MCFQVKEDFKGAKQVPCAADDHKWKLEDAVNRGEQKKDDLKHDRDDKKDLSPEQIKEFSMKFCKQGSIFWDGVCSRKKLSTEKECQKGEFQAVRSIKKDGKFGPRETYCLSQVFKVDIVNKAVEDKKCPPLKDTLWTFVRWEREANRAMCVYKRKRSEIKPTTKPDSDVMAARAKLCGDIKALSTNFKKEGIEVCYRELPNETDRKFCDDGWFAKKNDDESKPKDAAEAKARPEFFCMRKSHNPKEECSDSFVKQEKGMFMCMRNSRGQRGDCPPWSIRMGMKLGRTMCIAAAPKNSAGKFDCPSGW